MNRPKIPCSECGESTTWRDSSLFLYLNPDRIRWSHDDCKVSGSVYTIWGTDPGLDTWAEVEDWFSHLRGKNWYSDSMEDEFENFVHALHGKTCKFVRQNRTVVKWFKGGLLHNEVGPAVRRIGVGSETWLRGERQNVVWLSGVPPAPPPPLKSSTLNFSIDNEWDDGSYERDEQIAAEEERNISCPTHGKPWTTVYQNGDVKYGCGCRDRR